MTRKLQLQISSTVSLELQGSSAVRGSTAGYNHNDYNTASAIRMRQLSLDLYGTYREAGSRLCDVLRRLPIGQTEDSQAILSTIASLFEEFAIMKEAGFDFPVFVRADS